MVNINLKETYQKYLRVLQVARKPGKDEFTLSLKVSSVGLLLIGAVGFMIFLAFIFAGV